MKWIFWTIVIIAIIIGGLFYLNMNKPNIEVISMSEDLYLIIEDIIVDSGEPVIEFEDHIYFSYNFISEYIDEDIFYDENEQLLIITSEDYVKRFRINDLKGSINSKEFFIDYPVIEIANKVYLPYSLVNMEYDITIDYYEDTNAVVIDYNDIYYLTGTIILENPVIRTDMDIKAPIIQTNLEIEDTLNVYGEFEKWLKVRTKEGILGFIEKKFVRLNHNRDIYKTQLIDRETSIDNGINKINLTWDYTYSKVKFTDNIKPIPGVNVVSPTWFSITDEEGTIYDKGNVDYVRKYNDLGYELWPLIDNSFDPDLTHELLKSSSFREKLIQDILTIYTNYGFQGINIDFENVYYKDKDLLTQFVRELYPVFKENNIKVSMDVTTISTSENWSMVYDRERLHKALDYLFIMAYDQHWASSPVAGSVAEYGWVENGIVNIMELVPNEKIVLGIPFYTRLWIIEEDKVSSQSISMATANKFLRDNDITPIWDENIGQYYGEITKDNKDYRIWIEDEKSLEYKVSLVHKYNLAGIGSWRKGFETENIWYSLDKVLN